MYRLTYENLGREVPMIRNKTDLIVEQRFRLFEGEGTLEVRNLLNGPDEMFNAGRVFTHTILPPGASIGSHIHHGESETYYFLRGEGEFNDNGKIESVHAGDVSITFPGQGHGIRNIGTEPLELIALILYQK
jgi:quercetin dioxygenase-like cupin family protein